MSPAGSFRGGIVLSMLKQMHSEDRERERNLAHAKRLHGQVHLSMYRSMVISGCLTILVAIYAASIHNRGAAIILGLCTPLVFLGARIYRRGAIDRNVWLEDARLIDLAAAKSWSRNRWLITLAGAVAILLVTFRRH